MSTTLYRKYRPQTFEQVVNQNHIKVTLKNEISSGKIAHAYLFSGPRGVGKTTVARILAKALNCQKRQGSEPCDKCSSCEEVKTGRSLDLIEIDAASNRGINEIRELREQVRVTPSKENYKVFIIDEVHMLTTEAFNALLKTLEEPPAHAIFVLATTEIHKIPETIISRCQRFDFKKVPLPEIVRHLTEMTKKEKVKVEKQVLENIARHSEGYLRDAISFLGQILALGEKEIGSEEAALVIPRSDTKNVFEFVSYLLNAQAPPALELINEYLEEGGDLEFFTREIIDFLRRVLLATVTDNWKELLWDTDKDSLSKLQNQLKGIKTSYLRVMIEYLLEALTSIRQAEIIQLPLELAVIKIVEANAINNQEEFSDDSDSSMGGPTISKSKPANVKKPASSQETSQPVIKIQKIKQKWPEVIEALKEYNHSLSTFLKVGQPLKIDGQKLIVVFKYSFHWERVKENKNKLSVETTIEKVFGQKLFLEGEIDDKLSVSEKTLDSTGQKGPGMVEMVLDTLGGEVVE